MFKSAALRLTTGYLAIIMALSIGCSLALYNVSSNELARSAQRPVDLYNAFFGPGNADEINNLRSKQLENDRRRLKVNLLLFNVAVLAIGGGVSYFLARRTLEPIEEALEMQKRFTGDASHELRTPLTAMQTEIEVALRSPELTKKEAVDLLKSNLEEVGKLKSLSEGLLTLAMTDDNSVAQDEVSVARLVDGAIGQVAKPAAARKIKLNRKIKDARLFGSPQQLTNLIAILLDNAIKYSPSGSLVNINTNTKKLDKQVVISVSDHGQGIAAADLPHIFERFYRADTSRSKNTNHGYGLGLAIAKKIADLHHGSIDVKSSPGKGSTFYVRLPLA